jgi:hypothetical protein
MATTVTTTAHPGTTYLHEWASLANGEAGDAVSFPGAADRTVQVSGTFGAGGTVVIEGSNDNSVWTTLTDLGDNDLSFTAAAIEVIAEAPLYVRANVTAGDGTTDLKVNILARGGR